MGVEDLSKMLLEEFPDDYKEDIDKIKGFIKIFMHVISQAEIVIISTLKPGAKIDGEYFLSILKDELSLEIEISPGFKFHLNKNKQKVQ